jgi:hypothetical protein
VPSMTRKNRRTLMLICTNHWSWCVFTAAKLIVLQTARNSLQFNFIRASLYIRTKNISDVNCVSWADMRFMPRSRKFIFKLIEFNLRFIEIKFTGQSLVVRRLNIQTVTPTFNVHFYIWQKKPMRSYRKVHGITTGPKAIHSLCTVQLR